MGDRSSGHTVPGFGSISDTVVMTIRSENNANSNTYTFNFSKLPVVKIASDKSKITEGESFTFTVSRSYARTTAQAVRLRVTNSGATVTSGAFPTSVTIAANETAASPITITTAGDSTWDEHAVIEATVLSDDDFVVHSTQGVATVDVLDNDYAAATASMEVDPLFVGEAAQVTRVTLKILTNGATRPHKNAVFTISTTDATATKDADNRCSTSPVGDYEEVDETVTISENSFVPKTVGGVSRYEATYQVEVPICNDQVGEDDKTFTVAFAGDANIPSEITIRQPTSLTVTILDDDRSNNANLSSLSLRKFTQNQLNSGSNSGSILSYSPSFMASKTLYKATDLASSEVEVELTFTKAEGNAVVVVEKVVGQGQLEIRTGDERADRIGHQFGVSEGTNNLVVTVTAHDGRAKRVYTVTINRIGTNATDARLSER